MSWELFDTKTNSKEISLSASFYVFLSSGYKTAVNDQISFCQLIFVHSQLNHDEEK